MTLKPAPVSTERFTYSAADRMFTAFISDLGPQPFGRVYDDACDEGLTLVSHRSGYEVTFVQAHTERDAEHDIQYWLLKPTGHLPAGLPAGLLIRIYND